MTISALFDSLRDRLEAYRQTGDAREVLAPATLVDGARLILERFDSSSCSIVGTLLLTRRVHVGEQLARADEIAAVAMFTIVRASRPGMVPEMMRMYFNEHPLPPAPAYEVFHTLGAALVAEFERSRHRPALDYAIALLRLAAGSGSAEHKHAPRSPDSRLNSLFSLGALLWRRFELAADLPDVEQAVAAFRFAIQCCRGDHPLRPDVYKALATTLVGRYHASADAIALDEAIFALEAAIATSPADAAERPTLMQDARRAHELRAQHRAVRAPTLKDGSAIANAGLVHQEAGRLHEALSAYLEALPLLITAEKRVDHGRARNNLGTTYRMLGRYEDAAQQHDAAVAILREVGDTVAFGRTLSNLSVDYRLLGRYEESMVYCTEALQLLRDVGDTRCVGSTLVNLGGTYLALERVKEAAGCFRDAMAIFEQLADGAAFAQSRLAWEQAVARLSSEPN